MSASDDLVAVWALQERYADVVTRRAWDELHDLFLPDVVIHLDDRMGRQRAFSSAGEFHAWVARALERYDAFTFLIANRTAAVDPSGEAAAGRFFFYEIRRRRGEDHWNVAHGVYEDRFAKRGGRWWFAERRFRLIALVDREATVLGLPEEFLTIPVPGTGHPDHRGAAS